MKVIIIGAGISGLTVAYELAERGHEVHIYEKGNTIGGMARSIRINNNSENVMEVGGLPTEHSWRGYGPFYHNCYDILKRIPLTKKEIFKSENRIITTYKGDKYDITEFEKNHPGGSIIKNANGRDLEEVWKEMGYEWHLTNNRVLAELKKYKINTNENFDVNTEAKVNNNNDNNTNTVYSNLTKSTLNFKLLKNNKSYPNLVDWVSYTDLPLIAFHYLRFELACLERKEKYYSLPVKRVFNSKTLSKDGETYLMDFGAGPGLGLDKNTASFGHYAQVISLGNQYPGGWKVMNQPTSEGWFDHWYNHLTNNLGVKIYLNHVLDDISLNDISINDINQNTNLGEIVGFKINGDIYTADKYVLAIDPNSLTALMNKINSIKSIDNNKKLNEDLNVVNNQIGFVIGFNKEFNYANNTTSSKKDCFVLTDSPNNITFYPQDLHWNLTNKGILGKYKNKKIKSLWSGTAILTYEKGSLFNKSMTSLTIEELKKEIIHQFMESQDLIAYISDNNNGHKLSIDDIEVVEVFEDWYYDNETKTIKSYNPKWVNTFFNRSSQPSQKLTKQLYLAGGHTKTSLSVWSMEASIESGKLCSNYILEDDNLDYYPKVKIYKHIDLSFVKLFNIIRYLDKYAYNLGLPHIGLLFIITLIIFSVLLFIKFKKTQ
jgi:cytochrome b involved in lipid metabolism